MEQAITSVTLRQRYSAEIWKTRVSHCRSSGRSVTDWCKENGICPQTYYRWERKLLGKAEDQKGASHKGQFVELPAIVEDPGGAGSALTMRETAGRKDAQATSGGIVAVIRAGGVECEIHSGIEEELLKLLLRNMNGHA